MATALAAMVVPAAVVAAAPLSPLAGGRGLIYAGSLGEYDFSGDGGAADFAAFDFPSGLAIDNGGKLLVADSGNRRIRRIDTTRRHVIRTIAGNGTLGFATESASATSTAMPFTGGVAVGPHGDIYITTSFEDGASAPVYRVDPTGRIHRFAGVASSTAGYGGDGGPATAALIDSPRAVATDAAGNVYIAEGFRIRKVNPAGIISTYAGGATEGFSGDGGPATLAKLERPEGVATDGHGNVYVTTGNRVRKITQGGIISTIAGTGAAGFSGDGGRATTARLSVPLGVAADGAGNVYVADFGNERVRAVNAAGLISTVAGGGKSFTRYGPLTDTTLNGPAGLVLDPRGDLFISDRTNSVVRELRPPLTPAAAGSCTKAAATQLVERQHLGGFTGFMAQPVAKVLCGPFLGAHSHAMIVELNRETCTGAEGFVVYRHVGAGWHRNLTQLSLFGVVFRRGTSRFIEEHPLPGKDGIICTSRRWVGRTWHWNGRRLVHGRYHRVKAPTHI
jgi:sugar lactone lactonase YvrE